MKIAAFLFLILFIGCHHKASFFGESRNPASIQKVFDFSYLEGQALQLTAKQRVLNSFHVATEDGDVIINLGNFVLLNEKKEKDFACGFYDHVQLKFEAEGVSVDGEKPVLTIQTTCEIGSNINELVPIKLPVQKLLTQKPSNSEFKFYESNQALSLTLSNSPPEWPKQWALREIKLYHSSQGARVLRVASEEGLRSGESSSHLMKW